MRFLSRILAIFVLIAVSVGYRNHKTLSAPETITNPRNIYIYDTLLFVSDSASGIFVYSNACTFEPRLLQVIPIRGNGGMAFKDSILYADSYGSILALHIDSDSTFHVEKIVYGSYGYWHDTYMYEDVHYSGCMCEDASYSNPISSDVSGMGGSYAIFVISGSYLYHVRPHQLVAINITDPANPIEKTIMYTNWFIETIHPVGNHLFLGTQMGMEIYDINTPETPEFVSRISHARAFDPVVVADTIAYITLRDSWINTLGDVLLSVSIANINIPRNLDTLSISTPYGLAVSDSLVYVAKGNGGYALINATTPSSLTVDTAWTTPAARDFIWTGNDLYFMGMNSLAKYDVTDPRNPALVWSLP
jgi:hypothetical protein